MKNLFCLREDLSNESTVEALFVDRLLNFLGYPDDKVLRKTSIKELDLGKGSIKENYKPDYILLDANDTPIVIIDAKSPKDRIEAYHYQVSGYALRLNQQYSDVKPVLYTILTNGLSFAVYPWDSVQPIFYLRFEDFTENNERFLNLRSNLSFSAFKQVKATKDVFEFQRPALNLLIKTFNDCHNIVWKKEKISPTDAFYEFAKLMFLKIKEDNKIHSIINDKRKPSLDDFIFSTKWIEKTKVTPNPINDILFREMQKELEKQIKEKRKKRIFEKDEQINLKPSTIFEVVKKLEHFDLYGIDEDLNGRMFETFLNATIRGKELGQYFTPRGVVHYMVDTAPISVSNNSKLTSAERASYILDGCCGSGGFLIDTMARFTQILNGMTSLTNNERTKLLTEIKNNHIYGIEANPKIARISRLNMYLHGDGGSKIFKADTLDKNFYIENGLSEEDEEGIKELRSCLKKDNFYFDIILTNPPFSMSYKKTDKHEKEILKKYRIAQNSNTTKSNVLFLERYWDLLKPDSGELLTVIDDTVLNGIESQPYRDFIFENFIIRQIISLPFNTFYRAGAGVKTSILHLRRKAPKEEQGNVFMAITNNIGHDDHGRDTPDRNNMYKVAEVFNKWYSGEKIKAETIHNENTAENLGCPLQVFEVPAEKIKRGRIDAFYYSPEFCALRKSLEKAEREGKIKIRKGSEFNVIPELSKTEVETIDSKDCKYFEIGDVTPDGIIVSHQFGPIEELPTRARLMVKENDVIFAKNISSRGTSVIIPSWFNEGLVTTGFIGIRPRNIEEGLVLWNIFRSECFKKQLYYLAITATQPEIREEIFNNEMLIPWPATEKDELKIIESVSRVLKSRNILEKALKDVTINFEGLINLS